MGGTVVPVDAAGIVVSTLQVVLAPILVGMTMNAKFPKVVKKITPVTPVIGMVSTCLLVAAAVGQVAEPIMNAGLTLQLPVMLLHLVGGVVGYWGARVRRDVEQNDGDRDLDEELGLRLPPRQVAFWRLRRARAFRGVRGLDGADGLVDGRRVALHACEAGQV